MMLTDTTSVDEARATFDLQVTSYKCVDFMFGKICQKMLGCKLFVLKYLRICQAIKHTCIGLFPVTRSGKSTVEHMCECDVMSAFIICLLFAFN